MTTSVNRSRRRSAVALALCLLGVLLFIPSAQADRGAEQRFLILSTDGSPEDSSVVLGFGKIHAKGVDKVISDTKDVFIFPKGKLFVTHEPEGGSESGDPKTCLFKFTENGDYWITGGTGAYKHASGRGEYEVKGTAVGCSENSPPEVFFSEVKAAGSLDF